LQNLSWNIAALCIEAYSTSLGERKSAASNEEAHPGNGERIIITGVRREFETFISHRRTALPPEGYISKPFGREELLAAVQRVLGINQSAAIC
jgi:CheY-like chemotaxis protein